MTTLIIDGNNLAHRCKHSFQLSYQARDVSITYGFLYVLTSNMSQFSPTSVIVCWDGGVPKDRRETVISYKAERRRDWSDEEAASFYGQVDSVRRVLPSVGAISVFKKGLEADDLMYHASKIVDDECIIVSTDADMVQAITVDGRVKVFNPSKDAIIEWDNFYEFFELAPEQYLDYRVLVGDSSDNIPGVKGIGDVYAKDILSTYGTLDYAMYVVAKGLPWEARKLGHTKLMQVDKAFVNSVRYVIDLSDDRYGSEDAVRTAIEVWHRYQPKAVKLFMRRHGFLTLMDNNARAIRTACERLVKPKLSDTEEAVEIIRIEVT